MRRDFLTLNTAKPKADAFIKQISDYSTHYQGRGIVICGGGIKYFTNAWVAIRMLRHLRCALPIQIWHLGPEEVEERMRVVAASQNVEFVDANEVRKAHPVRTLTNGWELKPFSLLYCSFREVLLLDADNVPVVNPEFLFETPQYQHTGAVFWPDFGHLKPSDPIWEICGVSYRDEPEWESGQIVVDKQKCYKALRLALWYNEHSDFYYQYILGDKDTYHLAFRKLEQPVAMPSTPVRALRSTLCQHDFHGNRIFQHRVGAKWNLNEMGNHIWGFEHDRQCHAFIEELRLLWFGEKPARVARVSHTQRDLSRTQEVVGKIFQYERVGMDTRLMSFGVSGRVLHGKGVREQCWDLKEEQGNLVFLLSSETEVTCKLNRDCDGVWRGHYLQDERIPVVLRPICKTGMRLEQGKGLKNVRPIRERIHVRVDGPTEELSPYPIQQITSSAASLAIDLRILSGKPAAGATPAKVTETRASSDEWEVLLGLPREEATLDARTILITASDSLRASAELVERMNVAAGIIVPSEWNACSLSSGGVEAPIWIAPPGIDAKYFHYTPMDMKGPCVFGAIDTDEQAESFGKVARVAECFRQAFPNQNDVVLEIYSKADCSLPFADPRVKIVRCLPSDEMLAHWFQKLTCFISLGKPKGWPGREYGAMAVGRPLIAKRFGGITDFFSADVGYPAEFDLMSSVGKDQGVDPSHVNLLHVVELMRQVCKNRVQARQFGINSMELVSELTWERFAEQLLRILEDLDCRRSHLVG